MFDPAREPRTWDDIKESCGIDSKETIKWLSTESFEFFVEHGVGLNTDSELIQQLINLSQNPPHQPHNKATKIAVMAPRGHSKTYTGTVLDALWRAFKERGKQIILSSASKTQSKDILDIIKRIINRNDMLKHLRPTKEHLEQLDIDIEGGQEGGWGAESITTTTDVSMKVKTFGSTIRSSHVDYVYLDDVLQDDKGGTRSRKEEKDIFYNVITPIVENHGGTIRVVGTPMSEDDLLMELMDKDSYWSKRYQAYYPDSGELLWPSQWTVEQLKQKRAEIGPTRFAREYLCQPISDEERFFPESLVQPNVDEERTNWRPQQPPNGWQYYLGVDIAMSDDAEADYTVLQVIGKPSDDDHFYHIDQRRKKGLTPKQILGAIKELDELYSFRAGLVERNSIGMGTWKTIESSNLFDHRIDGFDTTRKTRPTILSQLQAAFDRRDLTIVDDDTLTGELYAFKNRGGKLKGKEHDDTVMALAIAWHVIEEEFAASADVSLTLIDEGGDLIDLDDYEDVDIPSIDGDADDLQLGIV